MFKFKSIPISSLNFHSFTVRRSRALAQALPAHKRKKNRDLQTNAFTIIEVVLVLAIAGLIFLMVFIALPALQRNQRDSQRKSDLTRVMAATTQMRTNNRGRIPASYIGGDGNMVRTFNNTLRENYLTAGGDQFQDPDGSDYLFIDATWPPLYGDDGNFHRKDVDGNTLIYTFVRRGRCDGDQVTRTDALNDHAFLMVLESGGTYCLNN